MGWVIAFPQEDRFGGDQAFADTLIQGPSVLAMFENLMVITHLLQAQLY